jgi:hypothetical protein
MNCDWAYDINQPLECFLNHPQAAAPGWNYVGWIMLAIFIGIGALLDRKPK